MTIVIKFIYNHQCIAQREFDSTCIIMPRKGEIVNMKNDDNIFTGVVSDVEHRLSQAPKEVWISVDCRL